MDEGERVLDREDDDPDEGVVVWRPEGTTIADWEYEVDGETYTTAESNPDYPEDEQLVLVSFREQLAERWPEWENCPPEDLIEEVRDRDIPRYGFPESRLADASEYEEEIAVPEEFDEIRQRLEENGFEVTLDEANAELHVQKYGTEYVVAPDGTVEGDEGLRNRVTSIVNRYL